jgi:hypothetical protein
LGAKGYKGAGEEAGGESEEAGGESEEAGGESEEAGGESEDDMMETPNVGFGETEFGSAEKEARRGSVSPGILGAADDARRILAPVSDSHVSGTDDQFLCILGEKAGDDEIFGAEFGGRRMLYRHRLPLRLQ